MPLVITTASITRCFKSGPGQTAWTDLIRRAGALLLALCLAVLLPLGAARAEPTDISTLRVERHGDSLLLTAQLRFDLPPVVQDALQKGIPLYFVAEATLMRDRWYWYDQEVASAVRYMRLSYHPLTQRWRMVASSAPISQTGLSLGQSFDTREEALAAVRRISGWKIADSSEVDPDARQYVNLRFRLDVSQLPRPFQIGVAGHPDWSIAASRSVRLSPESLR